MATTELNPAERVNISHCDDSTEKADESHATAMSRRQTECYQFRAIDLLHYTFSVTFFFANLATDSIVCVVYLLQGHLAWGCFAMIFTILPACITQLFSLRWHHSDGSLQTVHWLSHFLLFGFLHRYWTLFYTATCFLRNKPSSKDRNWVYRQESDICMLHLFQSFMGAAPQLILQLYVIAMLRHAPLWTSASTVASFCSLTWAVSTYVKAMHNINRERNNATWVVLALQALWRGGMLLSRIGVLVLATLVLKAWFFLIMGSHWLFMTIWVTLQTEFCSTVWEKRAYNCIIGLIFCFDFFNLCKGKSRCRVFVFYSVFILENLIFLIVYALRFQGTIANTMMVTIASMICGGMFIGLVSMLIYYGEYHPSRMAASASRNVNEHSATANAGTPRSFKLFHRGSLVSLHHSIDISPRIEEVAIDKQSLLRNIAQMSDCVEEGIINRNYSSGKESNASSSVRISTECERPHSRVGAGKHKEEILPKDNLDNASVGSALLSCPYPGLADIDSSRKRRGIYEHDITPQLDWRAPDILNIDLDRLGNLNHGEGNNLLSLDTCSKVIDVLDIMKNRRKLTTPPTSLESGRIFDIEKQQRDETMSCVTSIHDYENVCPLGIARPPWCIRSWKGYTDIETYIHDDSVVRDRRRDTLTSTTGTTYSSEYSDGIISRGALKEQDDYADALTYDLVESKDAKVSYSDDSFSASTVDDQNASLFVAKPVVIDDRGGMLALDTILEERDDSGSSDEFQRGMEPLRNSASTLVSTIDQIRRYTAENSPRHVYHTTGTQWEDLSPKNLMTRAHFAKVLFDNNLRSPSASNPVGLIAQDAEKREIDAIREVVRCCAIESIKKTPLIEAILSDSPILGSRVSKLARQITFADRKDNFDVNESDLYVEMSPLVAVENGENSSQTKLVDAKVVETDITKRSSPPTTSKKSDKENLAPILPNNNRRISNMRYDNRDNNDRCAWTIERDDKYDKSMCNVRFNLKEKRHLFLEQVLSPVPKLWNKRISFHPSTKHL